VEIIYEIKGKAEKLYAWHWKEWKKQYWEYFWYDPFEKKDNITVDEWYRSFRDSLMWEIN
jgi:hypothetical protein